MRYQTTSSEIAAEITRVLREKRVKKDRDSNTSYFIQEHIYFARNSQLNRYGICICVL